MTKRKSYNPFKMREPAIGAVIGYIVGLIDSLVDAIQSASVGGVTFPNGIIDLFLTAEGLFWIFLGFFVGWAIHSLIRRLSK